MHTVDWRPIPNFLGYEVSYLGEVRSWNGRHGRRKIPKTLKPFKRRRGKCRNRSGAAYVKLMRNGKGYDTSVMQIVARAWKSCPDGLIPYHIDGDSFNNAAANIGFTTRSEIGKMHGANGRRKPVAKIDSSGEPVEFYPSARQAAIKNYMSYQTVMDRCNGLVKAPFALTGFSFRWDEG